jgi:hypothetical protein
VVVAAGAGATLFVVTRGSGPASTIGAARRVTSTTTAPSATTTTTTTPTTTTVDPGSLPQTIEQPTSSDPQFQAEVRGFWQAVVSDDPTPGMAFFFPLGAYLQVKAIANPAADWQQRLVAAYQRDLHALHAALGAGAAGAQLTGVDVPAAAQWIRPGAEYNKGSYWRVYGAQVHYTVGGRPGTITIASMISWRGHWYLVHLARIA